MVKSFSPLIGKDGENEDLNATFKALDPKNEISKVTFDLILK